MLMTIAICTALAIIIISSDLSWSNLVSKTRNDLVFEERLKEYGAYQMRKESPRNLVIALFLTVGLAFGAGYAALAMTGTEKVVIIPPTATCPPMIEIPVDITPPKDEKKIIHTKKTTAASKPIVPLGLATVDITTKPVAAAATPTKGGTPDGEETGDIITPEEPISKGDGLGQAIVQPEKKIHDFSQDAPQFPGGAAALYEFLYANINYSQLAIQNNYQGVVYASFVIDEKGDVSNVKIVRGITGAEELDKSVIQAIRKMPKWTPGKNGGKPVAVRQSIPVKFILK
jgi:protein TonB